MVDPKADGQSGKVRHTEKGKYRTTEEIPRSAPAMRDPGGVRTYDGLLKTVRIWTN